MRVTTWNVNGLRSAARKRLDAHLRELEPDVLLLQEVRCTPDLAPRGWARPRRWRAHWHPAERKGYAGVLTCAAGCEVVGTGLGGPDPDGRVLHVRVPLADGGFLHAVNVYVPSGARGARQAEKDLWLARFLPWAERLAAMPEPVVMGGDFNIAHTEADIHDPRSNAVNSGFLPHERAWFGSLLASGLIDLGRRCWGERQGPYTWWSNQGRARLEDRGWRLDYLLGNAAAAARCTGAWVHRAGGLDTSDHAPVTVELDLESQGAADPQREQVSLGVGHRAGGRHDRVVPEVPRDDR